MNKSRTHPPSPAQMHSADGSKYLGFGGAQKDPLAGGAGKGALGLPGCWASWASLSPGTQHSPQTPPTQVLSAGPPRSMALSHTRAGHAPVQADLLPLLRCNRILPCGSLHPHLADTGQGTVSGPGLFSVAPAGPALSSPPCPPGWAPSLGPRAELSGCFLGPSPHHGCWYWTSRGLSGFGGLEPSQGHT